MVSAPPEEEKPFRKWFSGKRKGGGEQDKKKIHGLSELSGGEKKKESI